ncbi:trihelix transcription factor GT-2-like [Monomorium pharaonis]|uniref:trihelix transcription factor GT-2-like n=1 Tax=Monomorium pharaonis TaxID=307658 RepID=UPI0017476161|nr:trihelix transcription factor GT-2-like [Monomorium pharaonis]
MLVVLLQIQSIKISTIDNDLPIEECEEGSLYRWTDSCVILLLRTYQELETKFTNGKMSHKKCWEQVATLLKEKGYNVTGPQCASKLRSLKKTYKSIKDYNAKSGNDRRTWQHFEIMEEIFAKRAWCKPVALASSSGLLIKNTSSTSSCTNDNSSDDDIRSSGSTKITRTLMAKLLEKRLSQKRFMNSENKNVMKIEWSWKKN